MKIAMISVLLLVFGGCASYRMGPHQRQLPGGHQKIFVTMFENRTQEVGIESDMTNAFIQEVARSGVGTVTNKENADVVLQGVIHTVDYLGKSAVNLNNGFSLFSEYQTRVTIVLKAIDRQDKELWQGQFIGEKNYKAPQMTSYGLRTANPIYNQNARRRVIVDISKDMAFEAVGRMTENF